ncbi:aspartate/glutamate racemase family protein [Aminobacter aminovorans]|uniref:aspartate/glutamate racemase family protein n=1 Tax=Aminobacter TaxID=31988 RepID=UPI00285BD875|nr:aspartate/glutamate racemase family protein [Aminobacter aminovorans]MDR7223704.1 allantoin racemase [Aminobacter aminovorans]
MKIRDIVPVRSPKVMAGMKEQRQLWAREGVEIEVVPIERGPFSMEFATEEVLAGPYILEAVRQAEKDGVDAVTLDCCVDPVLRAARETVRIPVLAPLHSGLHVASMLGYRIAVLSMRNGQPAIEEHIRAYGFDHKVCSMHIVDCPPADLIESAEYCLEIIERAIDAAMTQHRADVILFACTAMSGYVPGLRSKYNLPIVEPMACAITMAAALVTLGMTHSKVCFETLPARGTAPGSIDIP